MKTYALEPFDSLFFRDGRPFNQGEASLFGVPSQFPPAPPTLVGALRAAVARNQGWSGGPWKQELIDVLGNGQSLGGLSFSGPYLLQGNDLLLPAPAHLLGEANKGPGGPWKKLTRLAPGPERCCDLGDAVRLPVAVHPLDGLKELSGYWLARKGMEAVLAGELPALSDVVDKSALWRQEARTGLGLDPTTRSAKEGHLYSCSHIRFVDKNLQMVMSVSGLPDRWVPEQMGPVGGENRMAWITPRERSVQLPRCPEIPVCKGKVRYTVTLVTPADLDHWPLPGDSLENLPGRLVSACQQRPQPVGGWDTQKRGPLPLKPLLTAGTTWFFEANADVVDILPGLHGSHIGLRPEFGFGQIIIGIWKEEE